MRRGGSEGGASSGVWWALLSPRHRVQTRGVREWALVIRSFIHSEGGSFTSVRCVPGPEPGAGEQELHHTLGPVVGRAPKTGPTVWATVSPVSAGQAGEAGVCKCFENSHPDCDVGRCCAFPRDTALVWHEPHPFPCKP